MLGRYFAEELTLSTIREEVMTVKKDIAEHKYLFHHGRNYRSYELFGAHRQEQGYLFRVWAPRAVSVAVIGDFNSWDLNRHPMKQFEDDESIWEVLCPEAAEGDL